MDIWRKVSHFLTHSSREKTLLLLVLGIAASFPFYFITFDSTKPYASRVAGVAILMSFYWVTEVIPLAVTALFPVILFPLLGVSKAKDTSASYFNDTIFLFFGTFIIGIAMERWNLHKRLALRTLLIIKGKPIFLLMGFMSISAFLSMWINNTATTAMMVPLVETVLLQFHSSAEQPEEREITDEDIPLIPKSSEHPDPVTVNDNYDSYGKAMILSVAYASSIGGLATTVGSAPNLILIATQKLYFPEVPEITFFQWLVFALPFSIILLIFLWCYLSFWYLRGKPVPTSINMEKIKQEYEDLGNVTYEEWALTSLCLLTIFLWLFRGGFGESFRGWSSWFEDGDYVKDGTVAMFIAVLMFMVPVKNWQDSGDWEERQKFKGKKKNFLLDWDDLKNLPWGVLILIGGGFALATGFTKTGLSQLVGQELSKLNELPAFVLVLVCTFFVGFTTELVSNTATANITLPILASLAETTGKDPLLLAMPAILACTCAFMLPSSTPPNAIAFGSKMVNMKVADMARIGFVLNVVSLFGLTIWIFTWGRIAFPDMRV